MGALSSRPLPWDTVNWDGAPGASRVEVGVLLLNTLPCMR